MGAATLTKNGYNMCLKNTHTKKHLDSDQNVNECDILEARPTWPLTRPWPWAATMGESTDNAMSAAEAPHMTNTQKEKSVDEKKN